MSLPGTFLMLGFIFIWTWIGDFALITLFETTIILGILLIVEAMEFALSGLAAKYSGAETRSAFLAIIGGLVGTIVLGSMFFIVGAIVGLFLGSYLGAYWGELKAGKEKAEARKVALGALMGSLTAKVIKSAVVIVMGVWMIRELI